MQLRWQADRDNRIDCGGFVAMVGGPSPGHLPEHSHDALQLTVHLGSRPSVRLIEPDEPHAGHWEAGVRVAVMLLAPSMIDEATEDLVVRGRPRFRSQQDTNDRLVEELANAILVDMSRPTRASRRHYFESIGYALAGHLVRTYTELPVRDVESVSLNTRQLGRVTDYVDSTLASTVSVRDMAAVAGMSPRLFATAFKSRTGLTPYQHVVQRRIDTAKRLLRTTTLSIAEIALRVGFCHQSHFTAAFSRAVGTSPGRWR